MKDKDLLNYFLGAYFKRAIESTVCVQLAMGKGNNKVSYPEEPFLQEMGLTEEERINKEIQKAIAAEYSMQQNDIRRGLELSKIKKD